MSYSCTSIGHTFHFAAITVEQLAVRDKSCCRVALLTNFCWHYIVIIITLLTVTNSLSH